MTYIGKNGQQWCGSTYEDQEINMGHRGRVEKLPLWRIAEEFIPGLVLLRDSHVTGSSEASQLSGILARLHALGIQPDIGKPVIAHALDKQELLTLAGQLYRYSVENEYIGQKGSFEIAARDIMLYVRSRYTLAAGPSASQTRRRASDAAE